MPRLTKGAKWTYGWVVVGQDGRMPIPPEAMGDYGFDVAEEVVFLPGSRRSGGFGLTTPRLLATSSLGTARVVDRSRIEADGGVLLPPEVGVAPGDRLLVVRGSGYALGLVTRGPIFDEALGHPELEQYE